MSSRRSTRATASPAPAGLPATPARRGRKAGSVVGSTVGGATPLPQVPTKESTSYGSGIAVIPTEIKRAGADTDLDDALEEIMKPARTNFGVVARPIVGDGSLLQAQDPVIDTPGPRARTRREPSDVAASTVTPRPGRGRGRPRAAQSVTSTPGGERTFNGESLLFGDATVLATPAPGPATILEESEDERDEIEVANPEPEISKQPQSGARAGETDGRNDALWPGDIGEGWDILHARAREARAERERATLPPWKQLYSTFTNGTVSSFVSNLEELTARILSIPKNIAIWFLKYPTLLTFLFLSALTAALIQSTLFSQSSVGQHIRSYGADMKHNIGQFIPHSIAHPFNYFNEEDVLDLQKRMLEAEYDISYLKHRLGIDEDTLRHLNEILPTHLVLEKNKNGRVEIPVAFWQALKEKIKSEPPLLKNHWFDSSTSQRGSNELIANASLTAQQVRKIAGAEWTDFLDQNEARIKAWQADIFDDMWANHVKQSFRNHVLLPKDDIVKMVRQNWEDSKSLINAEIKKILKQIDHGLLEQNSNQTTHTSHTYHEAMTRQEVKAISAEVFKSLNIPAVQLEAISKVKTRKNIDESLRRVNYFSIGNGAVIVPSTTSPTYSFGTARAGWLTRSILWIARRPLPSPNPPISALTKWDEQGDCWCATPRKTPTDGIKLSVMTTHQISPDQVVIEHIPKESTLDHGAAPREMELLAKVVGFDNQGVVGAMSERIFPTAPPETELDESYLLIASWTYDVNNEEDHIQAFPVQIKLKDFNLSTNQLVVRARNNWGNEDYTCLYRVRVHGDVAAK